MVRMVGIFIAIMLVLGNAGAVTTRAAVAARNTAAARGAGAATNTSNYNYNYMYPYMTNQMRTAMNPGTINTRATNPINTVVRTSPGTGTSRRVVPRTTARAATRTPNTMTGTVATPSTATANRRVVPRAAARSATPTTATMVRGATRGETSTTNARASTGAIAATSQSGTISSARCMADYTECMNNYCVRENTAYNKCYCSAKLAQIDATYKDDINNLIEQIIAIKNGSNNINAAEINEYWMSTIGKYYGENSWTNVDNALNGIDWSTFESRVRGQQAFATGHEYCAQHLRGCFYMASNMRDAYRSEIARDCATYETNLQRIKAAAETVIATYQE